MTKSNGSTPAGTRVETVRGSELYDKVILAIHAIRYPDKLVEHRTKLAKYKRHLGKKKETTIRKRDTYLGVAYGEMRTFRGFVSDRLLPGLDRELVKDERLGEVIFVYRPRAPKPVPYMYQSYDRSFGFTTHSKNLGLLADARFNREINPRRVEEYKGIMEAGEWQDLLSDPITITQDGQVINGQHRLAAASEVDWQKASYDPLFLVVWGVEPEEAMHADLSKRTPREQTTIVSKVANRRMAA